MNIDEQTIAKIGKYIVWVVVLVGVGYLLGIVFQVGLFLLPGLAVVAAAYYILINSRENGVWQTLKDTMKNPVEWIIAAIKALLPGAFK